MINDFLWKEDLLLQYSERIYHWRNGYMKFPMKIFLLYGKQV